MQTHIDTRTSAANLARVKEETAMRSGDGGVQISVLADDDGTLSSELKRNSLQKSSSLTLNDLAHLG